MGALCPAREKGTVEGKSGKSTGSSICLTGMKELAQALWDDCGLQALADTVLVYLHSEWAVFFKRYCITFARYSNKIVVTRRAVP